MMISQPQKHNSHKLQHVTSSASSKRERGRFDLLASVALSLVVVWEVAPQIAAAWWCVMMAPLLQRCYSTPRSTLVLSSSSSLRRRLLPHERCSALCPCCGSSSWK